MTEVANVAVTVLAPPAMFLATKTCELQLLPQFVRGAALT